MKPSRTGIPRAALGPTRLRVLAVVGMLGTATQRQVVMALEAARTPIVNHLEALVSLGLIRVRRGLQPVYEASFQWFDLTLPHSWAIFVQGGNRDDVQALPQEARRPR